jgi:hypothetical protein
MNTQQQWRLCSKCNSIFYAGAGSSGTCAAGGAHTADFFDCPPICFSLVIDQPATKAKGAKDAAKTGQAERGWRRCRKCQCLYFAGGSAGGVCPADQNGHDGDHVTQYQVLIRSIHNRRDADTRMKRCRKCQCLFRDSNWMPGVKQPDHAGLCPGRPEPAFPKGFITGHNGEGSKAYAIDLEIAPFGNN